MDANANSSAKWHILKSNETFFYNLKTENWNYNRYRVIATFFYLSPNFSVYFCVMLNFRQSEHVSSGDAQCSHILAFFHPLHCNIRFMKNSQKVYIYTSVKVNSNWTTRQTGGRFRSCIFIMTCHTRYSRSWNSTSFIIRSFWNI